MTKTERNRAAVRYDCMGWAMQTATPGEDAMMTIAKAGLYADFILGSPLEGVAHLIEFHRASDLK